MEPRIGCAGIIWKENSVLMGVRNKQPNKGKWIIPGGKVNFGERLAETLIREMREEAGITIQAGALSGVYEIINPPEHRIIVVYNAKYQGGKVVSGDDLASARFFSKKEIQNLHDSNLISEIVVKILIDAKIIR